ncbi:hypothetical protein K470DRAFT_254527 [Piedraia hortae CBS 480.64]|uniref:Thioesterase/thiol ester dehydrase-isomerase n=1 Tax=Piedraia hortae CBS 480.64 TaxID=1314780 RepID=A0A6A7C9L1_9PEZI|nr:hypothetical protein K470DRAFT_254527 [Piedraia hortae CBS 480.64]
MNARWLTDVKTRIGKCITFGMSPVQIEQAGVLLHRVARDWRQLVAGREGFLVPFRQKVTWGDMDSMGHVNNVVYNKYAEAGRAVWIRKLGELDPGNAKAWRETLQPKGDGLILRSITTEYKFPMTWPDRVLVYHKLRNRPDTDTESFILDVLIVSERHQRAAARCIEDLVAYDYRTGAKRRLPLYMRRVFEQTWKMQESSRVEAERQIGELLDGVRQLEKSTWDRKGAVEA